MSDNPIGHYQPEECARCRGTGIGMTKSTNFCPTCGGQGAVAVLQPSRKCARCDGNGLDKTSVDTPCPACAGSGWAYHWRK